MTCTSLVGSGGGGGRRGGTLAAAAAAGDDAGTGVGFKSGATWAFSYARLLLLLLL